MTSRREKQPWWAWLLGRSPKHAWAASPYDVSAIYDGPNSRACAACGLGVVHTLKLHDWSIKKHELFLQTLDFSKSKFERETLEARLRAMRSAEMEFK